MFRSRDSEQALGRRAIFVVVALLGCGPVTATAVIGDAETAVGRAHSAQAERYAPYETTLADLYLAKAREEQGHARYAEAGELGRAAQTFAETAVRKASERRAADQTPAPAK